MRQLSCTTTTTTACGNPHSTVLQQRYYTYRMCTRELSDADFLSECGMFTQIYFFCHLDKMDCNGQHYVKQKVSKARTYSPIKKFPNYTFISYWEHIFWLSLMCSGCLTLQFLTYSTSHDINPFPAPPKNIFSTPVGASTPG